MDIKSASILTTSHNARRPIRGSVIGQILLNAYIKAPQYQLLQWIQPLISFGLKCLSRPKRQVRYLFHSIDLILPITHPLPFRRQVNPDHLNFYGRIAQALFQKYPTMSATLFGADIGEVVASIRAYAHFEITAYEPNPDLNRLLNRNMIPIDQVIVPHTTDILPASPTLVSIQHRTPSIPFELPPFLEKTQATLVIEIPYPSPEGLIESLLKFSNHGYSNTLILDSLSRFLTESSLKTPTQINSIHHYFKTLKSSYFLVLFPDKDTDIFHKIYDQEVGKA